MKLYRIDDLAASKSYSKTNAHQIASIVRNLLKPVKVLLIFSGKIKKFKLIFETLLMMSGFYVLKNKFILFFSRQKLNKDN